MESDDGTSDAIEDAGQMSEAAKRALDALVDDFERSGQKPLRQSTVDRVLERRRLPPVDMLAVLLALETRKVEIVDDLKQRRAAEDDEAELAEAQVGSNGFGRYLRRIGRAGLLTAAEEVALGRTIANARRIESEASHGAGDLAAIDLITKGREARRRMIEQNIRLVLSIARRYIGMSDLTLEDLVQEGTLGLMRAVEKFDHTLGYKFSTYATWWIMQSITRAMADRGRTIRLPVHMADELWRVQRARRLLARQLGREDPDPAIIAEELDLDIARVHYLLGLELLVPMSLDAPRRDDDSEAVAVDFLVSPEPSPEDRASDAECRQRVNEVVDSLSPRERTIIMRRFGIPDGDEWTLEEVGRSFGLTRERIRQVEAKALRRLRKRGKDLGLDAAGA